MRFGGQLSLQKLLYSFVRQTSENERGSKDHGHLNWANSFHNALHNELNMKKIFRKMDAGSAHCRAKTSLCVSIIRLFGDI